MEAISLWISGYHSLGASNNHILVCWVVRGLITSHSTCFNLFFVLEFGGSLWVFPRLGQFRVSDMALGAIVDPSFRASSSGT